jgi:hypothetical protein
MRKNWGLQMQIETTFVGTKSLRSVEPGELVGLQFISERVNAIATGVPDNSQGRLFIVLPTARGVPYWINLSSDDQCMSFGTDWVLRLHDGDDIHPKNRSKVADLGAINRQRDGSINLTVPKHPADTRLGASEITFDLQSWTHASSLHGDGICFPRWSIIIPKLSRPGADFVLTTIEATRSE